MIDELSRIESIYGCVAEYYRCKEEEECGYYEPTEEEMEENRLSMAVYNEKIRILDGQPSDFILSLKKPDTVWCECEVEGNQLKVTNRYGSRELLDGWYFFRTNSKQKEPWIISNKLKINRVLSNEEVASICRRKGIEPQRVAE